MMAAATVNVAATMMGPTQLGMRCREMIRQFVAPRARPASMNSFSFSESTCPRTIRAVPIHDTTTSRVIVSRIEVVSPNAVRAHACFSGSWRMTSRATSSGKARNRSVARIRKSSNLPPLKPGEGADQRPDDGRRERRRPRR